MKFLEKLKMDLIVDSRDAYKEAILSLLERDEKACVLDLGCGDPRRLTYKVLDAIGTTEKAWGADLQHFKDDRIEIRHCELGWSLPFSPGVDVIIASQIIEHLYNTDVFLKEIYRVLKPGGYAIVSTPNLASWHNVLCLALGGQPETAAVSDELYPWKETPGHLRAFTATELVKLLEFHGFVVEKVVGSSYYPFPGRLARLLSKMDWKHAGTITVKARKGGK